MDKATLLHMGYMGIMRYILGLYRDNGKENGNYYIIIGYILGLYGSLFGYPKY